MQFVARPSLLRISGLFSGKRQGILCALGVLALCLASGRSATAQPGGTSKYPPPPPDTPLQTPSISFVPRPKDPLGYDIFPIDLNILHSPTDLGTSPLGSQDVIGPNGTTTPLPGHPDFSTFGAIFNNQLPTSGDDHIRSFHLIFDTSLAITDVAVDTFLRSDDLQSFVLDQDGFPIPTWTFTKTVQPGTDARLHWDIGFFENPDFPWTSDFDPKSPYPAFTILGSQFSLGSDIQFSYIPSQSDVPEPGVALLTASLLVGSLGLRARHRRHARR